ncbi:MAG: putative quinol monooxygenase [Faecalibacillus sp.]
MNKEVHIICKIRCKEENHDTVSQILLMYVDPAREEEGCLYYHVFENNNNKGEFYILDGWKDMNAVNSHVIHPNVSKINAILEPYLLEKQELTWGTRISGPDSIKELMIK